MIVAGTAMTTDRISVVEIDMIRRAGKSNWFMAIAENIEI